MAKVIVTDVIPPKKLPAAADLKKNRVRMVDGKTQTVYVIETQRSDVGEQLRKVFQLNVDRARRQAKKAPSAAE